jgi:uncharacterized integral membrane protein
MPEPMMTEEPIAPVEHTYGRRHDILYRAGLVLQVLGAAGLAALYPMRSPYYSAGIMLFEIGVLLAAIYLLVWISWIKKIVLGSVLCGIPLQVYGALAAPPESAGIVIIIGIGLVCVGAAGMVGKEAYCFSYREGWALMWLFPGLVLLNLFGKEQIVLNALGFSALFLLLLSLVGKKLRTPVLTRCGADVSPPPAT